MSSEPVTPSSQDESVGIGRIAVLSKPYPSIQELSERLKTHFSIPHLQIAVEFLISSYSRQRKTYQLVSKL